MWIKEACVGSFTESTQAVNKGAMRLELCDNLSEGGTTPSYGTLVQVHKSLHVPVLVMIRPRGGNFVYSPEEIEIMKADIEICKQIGVYGVVFGALTVENTLDIELLKKLMACAKPMQTTFHMAFDYLEEPLKNLETIIELGFDRILTKGSKTNALDGVDRLKALVNHANGRIGIVVGGGVTELNYEDLAKKTGATEFHGTKIVGSLSIE